MSSRNLSSRPPVDLMGKGDKQRAEEHKARVIPCYKNSKRSIKAIRNYKGQKKR